MASVVVTNSLFNDDVNVEDTELMKRRLEYLENEMTVPPDNIKNIIDKTADYVKKNGRQFEQKIYKEKKNQFSFLHVDDPYFFYYQYKLHQLFLGLQPKTIVPKAVLQLKKIDDLNKKGTDDHILKICDIVKDKKTEKSEDSNYIFSITDEIKEDNEQVSEEKIKITENLFTVLCPFLGLADIEVIKTTALFVARNGNKFLQELIEREKYNSQYDFLRANNLYFNFFSQLIEAYLKCLIPEEDTTNKIKKYTENKNYILKYCYNLHLQNVEKKKEEEKLLEEGRQGNTFYDWNHFVVVKQIDFEINEEEKLPLSINFSACEDYLLNQKYKTNNMSNNFEKLSSLLNDMQQVEMDLEKEYVFNEEKEETVKPIKAIVDVAYEEVDIQEEGWYNKDKRKEEHGQENLKEQTNNETLTEVIKEEWTPSVTEGKQDIESEQEQEQEQEQEEEEEEEEKIVIVHNYEKTRKHKINADNVHLCPITNKPIDINDMTKHLKTLLLDPRWKEQKDKLYEKAKKETSFAPLEDIEGNLSQFVINRPDLFGSIDEEINEHSTNEKKGLKNTSKKTENLDNASGEQDVYSYIHDIYNRVLSGYPNYKNPIEEDELLPSSKKPKN